jgi:hypothetical protein
MVFLIIPYPPKRFVKVRSLCSLCALTNRSIRSALNLEKTRLDNTRNSLISALISKRNVEEQRKHVKAVSACLCIKVLSLRKI